MDEKIVNLIEENNKLLKENLELSRKNTKKIKRIQSYMRRTFIAKVLYWVLIILVTAGALYAVRPYVEDAVDTYNTVQEQFKTTSDTINNTSSLFKDVGILNLLFEESKDIQ